MFHTRVRLVEALAILVSLGSGVQAQDVERLEPPSGFRWATWGAPAISPDGEWIALVLEGPEGVTIERRRGDFREVLPGRPLLGVTTLRITNFGEVLCNSMPDFDPRSTEWTSSGPIDLLPGRFVDVSNDGLFVVADTGFDGIFDGSAMTTVLSWPFGDMDIDATAASADLSVICGQSWVVESGDWTLVPLRWDGFQYTLLSRVRNSMGVTFDVSSNGAVVAGAVGSWSERRPAIWIGRGEPLVIGIQGDAHLATDGGRFVSLLLGERSAVWTPSAGVRDLTELGLPSNESAQFQFVSASDDGTRLLAWHRRGDAPDQIGWALVTLPTPCHLDYATDGFVDFFDLIAFVDCFEGNCTNYRSADFNMDGFVDWADFAGFVEAFEAGC